MWEKRETGNKYTGTFKRRPNKNQYTPRNKYGNLEEKNYTSLLIQKHKLTLNWNSNIIPLEFNKTIQNQRNNN